MNTIDPDIALKWFFFFFGIALILIVFVVVIAIKIEKSFKDQIDEEIPYVDVYKDDDREVEFDRK